jgi:hypothetical protein
MRATSARASGSVLPISRVTLRASSSACCDSASRKEKSQRARSITGLTRQLANAARAARTAASTSSAVDSGTRAIGSPVAGFVTVRSSLARDGTNAPST